MSDLSDFKRRVYEPEIAALKAKLREAERERDMLKNWQRAYSKGRAGLVEQADQDFSRAEAAEAREAALAARLRALGYNVTAILESDLLATDPGATE